jgi:predicted metal-dependent HD superfamily phosphohydrolase
MTILAITWQDAWHNSGAQGDGDLVMETLVKKYSEPHRYYHSLQHLTECMVLFEQAATLTEHPDEIALALWFHDAIYDVHRNDNELKSAAWAKSELLNHAVTTEKAERIYQLILATRHSAAPATGAEQLLVDIDLAILGAKPDRFAEYELQIKAEYAWVPGWLYRRKRRAILKEFFDRNPIYSTDYFNALFEQKARDNLQRALV